MKEKIRNRNIKILIALIMANITLATIIFILFINRWSIVVTVNGAENVTIEYGTEYIDEGVQAKIYGSYIFKNGISVDVDVVTSYDNGSSKLDMSKIGEKNIIYSVNKFGLSSTANRTVNIVDTKSPEIELVVVENKYTIRGEIYEEDGFSAIDNYDGDLTDKVVRQEKDGKVIYTVSDSSGNTTEVIREIVYDDPIPPELTLEGDDIVTLLVGTEYEELGYSAIDNCDGDITEKVIINGEIDKDSIGEYVLTYTVVDLYGNKAIKQRTISYVDTKAPEITLVGNNQYILEVGSEYKELGYSAIDNYDGNITEKVVVSGNVNVWGIGDYPITYEVTDANGNTATVVRIVQVRDTLAPTISLKGDSKIVINVGDFYEEAGYTATDNYEGDLTSRVQVKGSVNINVPDTYVVTYSVSDGSGNVSTVQRTVICRDSVPPKLSLKGEKEISMNAGEGYKEPGYSATDNYEGDITSSVKVSNPINSYHAGTYTITYSVSDKSGNVTTDTRTVIVNAVRQPDVVKPSGKVIYLTFDDGPSKHTKKLLNILEQYNVKATFFVVNTPDIDIVVDIANAGHTVALHTFTHKYEQLYASESAYFDDLHKIQAVVYEKTGILSKMIRFPGGSSNVVSKKYCVGIMTSLTKAVLDMGYQYYDWNVTSGDAGGGANTSEAVFQNVIKGIQGKNIAIVLQHDIYGYSVDAVEKIIIWGLANGYTFLPLDETSPTSHHAIKN